MRINDMINKLREAHPALCTTGTRSFFRGESNHPSTSSEVKEAVFYRTNRFKSVRLYRELHST